MRSRVIPLVCVLVGGGGCVDGVIAGDPTVTDDMSADAGEPEADASFGDMELDPLGFAEDPPTWIDAGVEPDARSAEPPPFDGYRLPFRCGKTVRVSQGNNTSFSHQGRSRYAYDFAIARGTVLRAMARGRVVNADSSTRPGDRCFDGGGPECRNEANYVRIRHPDGKITAYWHLNRADVHRGDWVEAGDRIGRSGSSGYSTGPHAHIVRERNCDSIACQSIRLRFRDVRGDGMPDSGEQVTSGNCPRTE